MNFKNIENKDEEKREKKNIIEPKVKIYMKEKRRNKLATF